MGRRVALHWLIQKITKQYERLQKEREKRRRLASSSDSESESDIVLPEARPLPDGQWHVIYSHHSRSHMEPTLMHLVEFIGTDEGDEDIMNLAVHENVFAICSCDPSKDPDDETVMLYKAEPSSKIPLLDDGEHFLGGPANSVALTSAGILYSSLSPEDWTSPLRSYLGIPPELLTGIDELKEVPAYLTEKVMEHRTRFHPKLSPAISRRSQWPGFEGMEEDETPYYQDGPATKAAQIQTEEVKEPKRFALPASALTSAQRKELSRYNYNPQLIGAVREGIPRPTVAPVTLTTPNSLPWKLTPEYEYLHLDKDIPTEQWAIYGLDVRDTDHTFKTTRPLTRGEIRILTMHQNLGQNLYVSPTTIDDTLNMARTGWAYPNLAYPEAMAMLQSINFPEILGKELNECVVAWKETQVFESMFNQSSNQRDSLKFASEADLFKQPQTSRYLRENAPVMDRSLKETSPATLEKYLKECIKYGMEQGLHYKLWYILFGNSPHLKGYAETVKRAAAQYPKYKQILEKMASFWVLSLRSHASQDVDYEDKRKEFLETVLTQVQKGETAAAIVYLRSEAETLKTYNPNYAAEARQGGMTEEMQQKGTEREIRAALLSLLSSHNAPLEHIWGEMVQNHLRENPSGLERGPASVQNLDIEDLLIRFKNACDMYGFMKDKGRNTPVGVYNSSTAPPKEGNSKPQKTRCDKCNRLDIQCSPRLNHCKEKGHQMGQNYLDTNPKAFYVKSKCPHCMAELQRNIAKAKREEQMSTQLMSPPTEKTKCDKCMITKKVCSPRFGHCKLLGHQADQPQEDKNPAAWNYKDTCPFCAKGTRKKPTPVRSIFDDPPPLIPTAPILPNQSIGNGPGFPLVRAPFPTAPFSPRGISPFPKEKRF